MLPTAVAWSSSGMVMKSKGEGTVLGIFFPYFAEPHAFVGGRWHNLPHVAILLENVETQLG